MSAIHGPEEMAMHGARRRRAGARHSFGTRRRAVQLMLGGMSVVAAAASVGASSTSGYRWLARYRADGWAGLMRLHPETATRDRWMRGLVEAIARYRVERGYPPSIHELMERTGASSTSVVAYRLAVCEREGLLVRTPRRARALALTAAGWALAGSPRPQEAPGGEGWVTDGLVA